MLSKCSGDMSFTSVPGFRPHINANQIPSPIEAIELDRHNWADKTYTTLPGAHAPLSTTDFIAVDQGFTHCRIFCH
jgi:protein transport protein SEC24